jgi:hypothetical protein
MGARVVEIHLFDKMDIRWTGKASRREVRSSAPPNCVHLATVRSLKISFFASVHARGRGVHGMPEQRVSFLSEARWAPSATYAPLPLQGR